MFFLGVICGALLLYGVVKYKAFLDKDLHKEKFEKYSVFIGIFIIVILEICLLAKHIDGKWENISLQIINIVISILATHYYSKKDYDKKLKKTSLSAYNRATHLQLKIKYISRAVLDSRNSRDRIYDGLHGLNIDIEESILDWVEFISREVDYIEEFRHILTKEHELREKNTQKEDFEYDNSDEELKKIIEKKEKLIKAVGEFEICKHIAKSQNKIENDIFKLMRNVNSTENFKTQFDKFKKDFEKISQ